MSWYFKPYVSVAQRRAKAARKIKAMAAKGRTVLPVHIEGRKITRTFWGNAWCDHLESFSDYESRLPKGRSYVRNGSVCDLQIEPGRINAMVCGSELYEIKIEIEPVSSQRMAAIKKRCAGQIGSLIELLQGRLSDSVMSIITNRTTGLFPAPAEIRLKCSCPDWATMCKHVAAALYGVGARLDEKPELLFVLRKVDHLELLDQPIEAAAFVESTAGRKTIPADDMADVFGIEMEADQRSTPTHLAKTAHLRSISSKKSGTDCKAARSTKKLPGEMSADEKRRPARLPGSDGNRERRQKRSVRIPGRAGG